MHRRRLEDRAHHHRDRNRTRCGEQHPVTFQNLGALGVDVAPNRIRASYSRTEHAQSLAKSDVQKAPAFKFHGAAAKQVCKFFPRLADLFRAERMCRELTPVLAEIELPHDYR